MLPENALKFFRISSEVAKIGSDLTSLQLSAGDERQLDAHRDGEPV